MARGILGGLFGGSDDSSVMPGLLDQAGYMDPAEYDRRRQGDAMQGLWAGLLQGSGPSLEPRNFFSALGGGLAASQKSANEFDESQLRRAQGVAAFQKSALERQKLKLATDIYGEVLPKGGSTGAPPAPGAPAVAPDDAGPGSGRGAWGLHADVAIATLREQGFSDAAIQGIMANGLGEGGFDTPWRKAGGGENSFGHWQFNQGGELPGYLDFVQKQGGDPKDTRLQALYVAKRAEEVAPGFKSIDDPQKATDLFATKFERYQGAAPGQRYGLLTDAQRYMTGKPVEAVAPLAEVPHYGSDFERLPSETAIPGLIAAGAPGPAPSPGATVIPDNALPGGTLPVPGHEYVRLPNGRLGMRATTAGQMPAGDRPPTAVPPVTSTPGGTNGIDLRRGAALEQILSGQQTAQAGPPLRQLAQFAGPGAADSSAPAVPEAPAPGGITYGTGGMLGRLPPAPAAAAPAPGGTLPGAAAAPALPTPPELPPIPAIAMPQPLPPPPAAAALRPLEATGAAPAVHLSPEQTARTQRAQRLSLSLDLIGVTVPKFIADEAGIDVAARSAAAQEAAKQPFAVQMKRLEADTAAAQKRWDAQTDQQKETLAAQRGLTVKQLDAQYANIHERFKSELDLFTAGPKAKAIAEAQLDSELAKITGKTQAELNQNLDTPIRFEEKDAAGNVTSVRYPTPRELRAEIAARGGKGIPAGPGPRQEVVQRNMAENQVKEATQIQTDADTVRSTTRPAVNVLMNNPPIDWAGPLAGAKQQFNRLTTSVLGVNSESVRSYESAAQLMGTYLRQALRASDPNPTERQSINIAQTFPTPESSRAGYDQGLRYMAGMQDYQLFKNDELQKHLYDPSNPTHDPQGFRQKFQMSAVPFVVLRMADADRAAYLEKLGRVDHQAVSRLADQMEYIRTVNPNWKD